MAKKKSAKTDDKARKISALTAQLKQLRGEALSRQEQRDLAWFEHLEQRRHIEQWQAAVPKGEYCQLAGRQHKLINDAAETYDLPLDGPEINLKAAITALHGFIATNAHRLKAPVGDSMELRDEKIRQEIMKLEVERRREFLKCEIEEGNAIPKEQLRSALVAFSAKLRTLGQTLAASDPEARRSLNDFLDETAKEIESGSLAF